MRPTYETEQDRAKERAVAETVGAHFKCNVHKLPLYYPLDWTAERSETIVAFFEIKCRARTFDQYPDTWISLHKALAARDIHLTTNIRCLFIVKFDDCLAYASIGTMIGRAIVWGGRVDRGDWQDQEPCVAVPMADFKKIEVAELVA